MRRKKFITSIFVTDNIIGIHCYNKIDNTKSISKNIILGDNVIENGYIKKPLILFKNIKNTFKEIKFVPKNINFVFWGENILIRELTISKKELLKININDYIKKQIGKTLISPFKEATFLYNVKNETDKEIEIVIYITDKDLIEDYFDVFEKVGIKNISMGLLSESINFLFNKPSNGINKTSAIVSVLDHNISIHIDEDNMLVFGINHECEIFNNGVCDIIPEFIERIANYYQYNLRKGERKIENVILVNFTETMSKNTIFNTSDFDFDAIQLDITDINSNLKWDEKYSNVASIASLAKDKLFEKNINFNIKRNKPYNIAASYLFILTMFIFSIISLIYIPLMNYNRNIQELQNINTNLLIHQQMLEDNILQNNSASIFEQNYNNAYEKIGILSISPANYIKDILSLSNSNIEIIDIELCDTEKQITIIITSSDAAYLYDFSITLYEEFGITDSSTINKWIISTPAIVVSDNQMEVTVYYA